MLNRQLDLELDLGLLDSMSLKLSVFKQQSPCPLFRNNLRLMIDGEEKQ